MPFNTAGLVDPKDVDQIGLWSTNPGLGASAAAGEISGAPYGRKGATLVNSGGGVYNFSADIEFDIPIGADQTVAFVALFKGSVYKGYYSTTSKTFTGSATTRKYTVDAETSGVMFVNP
jgi:hypothetical protein